MNAAPQSTPVEPGTVRLKLVTPAGRSMIVGPLVEVKEAKRWAEDLVADGAVASVLVERRSASGDWDPAA